MNNVAGFRCAGMSDICFVPTQDASLVLVKLPRHCHPSKLSVQRTTTIASGNASQWVERTMGNRWPSAELEPQVAEFFLSENQARFAEEVQTEIDALPNPDAAAARRCIEFTETADLANMSEVRWAIFPDEDDAVTLVVHSKRYKRQVSFEFRNEGAVVVERIDEHMRQSHDRCGLDHRLQLRAAMEWVTHPQR